MSPERLQGFGSRLLLVLAVALTGCANEQPLHAWRARDLANPDGPIQTPAGPRAIGGPIARRLLDTYGRVVEAAGRLRPELLVTDGDIPNAYALDDKSAPQIAISLPMVALLADDQDALAALFGHELAHLYLRHQAQRQERAANQANTSGLLGFVLSAVGIPFGATLVDAATTTVERANTRDEENRADELGVQFMRQAGFDPEGAVRLQQSLAAVGEATLPFLATHPRAEDRIQHMRELSDRDGGE